MITGFTVSDKEIGFCDGDYSDSINRWKLKHIAKRLMKSANMRKIKIRFIDSESFGGGIRSNIYKATSAEGEVKYIQMDYNEWEPAYYYECFKID